jgi:uncharacterized RDD family membrane protein YckC
MADIAQETKQVTYVGFWRRFVAMWIDTLILTVVIALIVLPIYGRDYPMLQAQGQTTLVDMLINVGALVATILLWRLRGATPGKMLFSAKIVDASTFAPPSTGKLIGRFFAYIVSMLPLFLGFLWIAFDPRKQGWHDKLAGTVVIEEDDA